MKINTLNRRFLQVSVYVFFSLIISSTINAQTFTAKNVELYDNFREVFTQEIPVEVSGLPINIDGIFGLESVEITLHHNRTSDLKIQLQAPDGTTSWVTNRNGGLIGKNYIATKFSQFGKDGIINTAKNPFTGNFIPDGQFAYFNNNQNPNGTWKVLIEDLKPEEKGFLDEVQITFGKNPAIIKKRNICSFATPEFCLNNGKNIELLPDLVIVPNFTKTQFQEFSNDDEHFHSQLKISVAIANIGLGPLEVFPDTLGMKINKPAFDKSDKRFPLFQKIYSLKDKNFSSVNKKSGTIYYEKLPGHEHYHVDDWIEMRLVKFEKNKKIIVAKGAKVSYCLFTNGMLYEKDKNSIIDNKQYGNDLKNYGLGDYPSCELMKQGIAVGGYDYYGLMYEGQFLQLPKYMKNGDYILEIEIDPDHKYYESNRKNNLFSMPIKIEKQ
ncbi:lysyl oxidase family protein [Kaistella jeonii]|uniref:lysyl oxidase family protein n=1 Tax=Kaistella jeonii TaxID=266749 RepID=UPI00147046AB|nr:lysyl oxidase family protein [Kaistella jeonii]